MDFIPEYLRDINMHSIILRFMLAAFFSGIIGMSRGRKQYAAGLRTHLLVCIGAASVMMINQYIGQNWGGDMGRMGALVVSGIGFLGAGTILVTSRKHVKGLTSAAGIWASACMGLAIGIGFYEAAVVMCLILFIILSALERFDEIYIKRSREISVYLEYDASEPLSMVIQGIKEQGWRINELRQLNMNVENINCFILALQVKNSDISDETAVKELNNIDGVYYIEEV